MTSTLLIKILSWLITGLSLFGVILNIKKQRSCFVIWFFTNSFWCVYDWHIGAYSQSALFFVYALLAARGMREWKR